MEINKIKSTDALKANNDIKKPNALNKDHISSKDRIIMSEDSKIQALYKKSMEIIKNTPDIREAKVAESKALLESFKNPSNAILEDVSKKLLKMFGNT